MILTKRERVQHNITLCEKEYHPIMWRWILETFNLPEDSQNVTLFIDAIAELPRSFGEEEVFIPIDTKAILKEER